MKSDKRGQSQMTLGAILGIVLGIAVLVLLIWGFTQGWGSLFDQITGRTSSSNVEVRITDCNNDCSLGEYTAWCNEKKELKYFSGDEKSVKVSGTCSQFYKASSEDVEIEGNVLPKNLNFKSCSGASSVC